MSAVLWLPAWVVAYICNTTTRVRTREGSRKMWLWYSRYTCRFKIEFVLRFSINMLRLNVWKNRIATFHYFTGSPCMCSLHHFQYNLKLARVTPWVSGLPQQTLGIFICRLMKRSQYKMRMLLIISREHKIQIGDIMNAWQWYLNKTCARWGGVQNCFASVHVVDGRSSNLLRSAAN